MNRFKVFVLLFFIAMTTSVNAQLELGLKVGVDHNTVTRSMAGRVDVTYHEKTGVDYGLIARYQFNDWLALRTNVEILSRSHTMKRNLPILKDVYTDHNNRYLALPVMADFSFGGVKLRGHFMAGGFVSYWLNANIAGNTFNIYEEILPFDEKLEFNEYHNRFVAGMVTGAGVSYDLAENISLELDALYYYDLISYMKINKVSPEPRYNNTISLTLGLIYKL